MQSFRSLRVAFVFLFGLLSMHGVSGASSASATGAELSGCSNPISSEQLETEKLAFAQEIGTDTDVSIQAYDYLDCEYGQRAYAVFTIGPNTAYTIIWHFWEDGLLLTDSTPQYCGDPVGCETSSLYYRGGSRVVAVAVYATYGNADIVYATCLW